MVTGTDGVGDRHKEERLDDGVYKDVCEWACVCVMNEIDRMKSYANVYENRTCLTLHNLRLRLNQQEEHQMLVETQITSSQVSDQYQLYKLSMSVVNQLKNL